MLKLPLYARESGNADMTRQLQAKGFKPWVLGCIAMGMHDVWCMSD